MRTLHESSPIALTNGTLVMPNGVVVGKAILVEAGLIRAVCAVEDLSGDVERLDVERRLIAPGLVDIHIHGAQGANFTGGDRISFETVLETTARAGVTSVLATTTTAPLSQLLQSLAISSEWMDAPGNGSNLLGVHIEGPYFAASQAGAQDPAYLRAPKDGEYEQLLAWHQIIRIFTFAPELDGAQEITRRLQELGIVPAAGHSEAREDEIRPHFELGMRHMIHIWSGQSSTVRQGPWRKPGMLEVSLTAENVTVEMIGDGKHLPPTLMRLAYRAIGPDRLCLISDATSGAGLPNGSRFRMGEMEYAVGEGVGMLLDNSAFAGSTTLLNQVVRTVIDQVHIPLWEAVRMASLNPARVIGVDARKGSLEVGKDADIVVFDHDFEAWKVMIAGRWFEVAYE